MDRRRPLRWAVPGELAAADGRPAGRGTVRDWAADAGLFCFASLYWLWTYWAFVVQPDPEYVALIDDWMLAVDPWVGAVACLALWWRRRFPLALAIAMVPVLLLTSTGFGAILVAIFTVAVHRSWLPASLVTLACLVPAVWWALVWQPPELPAPIYAGFVLLSFLVPLGWGMVVRFRRQLLVSLRREAHRERQERERRLAQARRAERERIAREMHDVLAHRISLLSVHAGALAYRTSQAEAGAAAPLTAAELGEAVQIVRDNAHQALTELGGVLAVLREDTDSDPAGGPDQPAPQLTDLESLVAQARSAGQHVTLALEAPLAGALPRPQAQRTAYRVVQEGLTNARKHAPYAPVAVRVAGEPGGELAVAVTNPLPTGVAATDIPGAGAGLAGLAERVALDGGTLDHCVRGGHFALTARLPWHA